MPVADMLWRGQTSCEACAAEEIIPQMFRAQRSRPLQQWQIDAAIKDALRMPPFACGDESCRRLTIDASQDPQRRQLHHK